MKKDWHHMMAKRKIPEDVKEDLTFWKETLDSFKHLRLISSPEPLDISWVGDASTSYGIGVLVGKRWVQIKMTDAWHKAPLDYKHINYLETVAIRIGLLMVIGLGGRSGKHLVVWTDNTTAQAAVTNRKSRNKAVNEEWKVIQRLLIFHQIEIHARRVTSEDNQADKLSRGLKGGCQDVDRFDMVIPSDLHENFVMS